MRKAASAAPAAADITSATRHELGCLEDIRDGRAWRESRREAERRNGAQGWVCTLLGGTGGWWVCMVVVGISGHTCTAAGARVSVATAVQVR